jgi:predicted nucleic acid-binding protein
MVVRFVDTNVLLYAISRDLAEQDRAKRANDLLGDRDLALLVQVLQEFYVQATRASRRDAISRQQAVLLIESFRRFPVQDLTSGIMLAALDARQRFQLSYWDAAIIEAARAAGCTRSCPKTSTTDRTTAVSALSTRSAESGVRDLGEPRDIVEPLARSLVPSLCSCFLLFWHNAA